MSRSTEEQREFEGMVERFLSNGGKIRKLSRWQRQEHFLTPREKAEAKELYHKFLKEGIA